MRERKGRRGSTAGYRPVVGPRAFLALMGRLHGGSPGGRPGVGGGRRGGGAWRASSAAHHHAGRGRSWSTGCSAARGRCSPSSRRSCSHRWRWSSRRAGVPGAGCFWSTGCRVASGSGACRPGCSPARLRDPRHQRHASSATGASGSRHPRHPADDVLGAHPHLRRAHRGLLPLGVGAAGRGPFVVLRRRRRRGSSPARRPAGVTRGRRSARARDARPPAPAGLRRRPLGVARRRPLPKDVGTTPSLVGSAILWALCTCRCPPASTARATRATSPPPAAEMQHKVWRRASARSSSVTALRA